MMYVSPDYRYMYGYAWGVSEDNDKAFAKIAYGIDDKYLNNAKEQLELLTNHNG